MKNNIRLAKSRDNWRAKAGERRENSRRLANKVARRDRIIDRLRAESNALKYQISCHQSLPIAPAQIQSALSIRALCVLLIVLGSVSFRSIPRILAIMNANTQAGLAWIPSFTSVINWTLRFGLAKLQNVEKWTEPWMAIIDCSIDVSVKKVLVVLRVGLKVLAEKGEALGLDDCECIGVEVGSTWCGETISQALTRIFQISGNPTIILKDQGSDLGLGVRLWKKIAGTRIFVVDDIGHVMANALKATFGKLLQFSAFLDVINKGAAKIRQSDIAFLAPPKIRTKGRFQSITALAAWAKKILAVLDSNDHVMSGIKYRLWKFFPLFRSQRLFLEKFCSVNEIVSQILKILKREGLNQTTYQKTKNLVEQLPPRSKIRKKIDAWLRKHLQIQCRIGIGQIGMPVSSDVIESLFGKFKVALQRSPKAEFSRIVLAIPALCGKRTQASVAISLAQVTHTDLLKWQKQNVSESQCQKRRNLMKNLVPKTCRAARL